jgi:hypothetical protein
LSFLSLFLCFVPFFLYSSKERSKETMYGGRTVLPLKIYEPLAKLQKLLTVVRQTFAVLYAKEP